jgi:UDP-N-acetylglucosamine 2-epimerase (non-hydrolysing)
MKKIAIVVGTRPEIIKESSIIREFDRRGIDHFVIHTGQHYSYNMDELFFRQLDLKKPKYNLHIKSSAPYLQGEHAGRMLIEIEKILLKEMPDIVLVHGDTNSALAGALTTKKLSTTTSFTGINIALGHIEAGLRSHDNSMPEEINRRIADHLSDYLFAPTENAADNIRKEGISGKKIVVTGNTIVDAVQWMAKRADENVLDKLGVEPEKYFLVTVHRQENVDSKQRFENILQGLSLIHGKYGFPVIYPMHPRSKNLIERFEMKIPEGVHIVEPTGFMEFLSLEKNARLILTDSGGVQEEACVLRVPCVTLRDNTERPETLTAGSNVLAGTDPINIENSAAIMMKSGRAWANPFGNGKSGETIVDFIVNE